MVLVYGTVCLDRVRSVQQFPIPGGYAEVEDEQLFLGGEAANTANALKTWGVPVALDGNPIGKGELGELLLLKLKDKGLDPSRLSRQGRTPVCEVYVSQDGDRTMFGLGFRDMGELAKPETAPYEAGAWFTADPNLGDAARTAASLARAARMNLYLMDFIRSNDPIPVGAFWQSSTDWVGRRGDAGANLVWLRAWVERHGCFGILSDGPYGLLAGDSEHGIVHCPAFPCETLVDSTGAGDMLRAGMLYGLVQEWPVGECLAFGAAAGAIKCGHLGATSHVPSIEQVNALIRAHPAIAAAYAKCGGFRKGGHAI
ncbi:MAG: carbohydrate kinase family protein [Armatimonadetes bacterium]|nr:carbohydrate kinase family protein [Armatimonadota bacterium]